MQRGENVSGLYELIKASLMAGGLEGEYEHDEVLEDMFSGYQAWIWMDWSREHWGKAVSFWCREICVTLITQMHVCQ